MTAQIPQPKSIIRSITYSVLSATRQGVEHVVTEDVESGRRTCTCEASDHPTTWDHCWHLRAVNAGLVRPVIRITQRPARPRVPDDMRDFITAVDL